MTDLHSDTTREDKAGHADLAGCELPGLERAAERAKGDFEDNTRLYGRKAAFLMVLSGLARKIGFSVPCFELVGSEEFEKFMSQKVMREASALEANKDLIIRRLHRALKGANTVEERKEALSRLGNGGLKFLLPVFDVDSVEKIFRRHSFFTEDYRFWRQQSLIGHAIEAEISLRRREAVLPPSTLAAIRRITDSEGPQIKARSSSDREDSFLKSLAGRYHSATAEGKKAIAGAIEDIYMRFIYKHESPDERMGVVLQKYIDADCGGIAFSSLKGMTTIEAVIGSPETAVKGGSNVIIDMDGDEISEIHYGFMDCPDRMVVGGESLSWYEREQLWQIRTSSIRTRKSGIKRSPLSRKQIQKVSRVVRALEEDLGFPVDIEFAFRKGKLYVLQARPITGDNSPVEALPEFAKEDIIAKVPVSINECDSLVRLAIPPSGGDWETEKLFVKLQEEFHGELALVSHLPENVIHSLGEATVIIDPQEADRITHKDLVFREDGMVYLGCPGLIPLLEAGMEFETRSNARISKEMVRVISNGLRAVIVKADALPVQ